MDGVRMANVNLLTNSMEVDYDENIVNANDICKKVDELGYAAKDASIPSDSDEKRIVKDEAYRYGMRLLDSLIFAVPLFILSMFTDVENWVLILFTAWIVIFNIDIYKKGLGSLIHLAPTMDALISVGTIASLLIGYFDSVGMILTIVDFGKWLEARAKRKTTTALSGLMKLMPETATVIRDGEELIVKTIAIRKGETVICHPGEIIAVDGVITKGKTRINQANITGESELIYADEGTKVISGTINVEDEFYYTATEVGKDTVLSKIIELVEEASSSKAPISRLADKVSLFFVPTVILISIITTVIWLLRGYTDPLAPFIFGISVLVVSCPCALGLATPVAIMVGTGRGANEGILVKDATALENMGKVSTIIFDKTGTITFGSVKDGTVINDEIRPEAKTVIADLKALGIKTVLLSGDRKEVAERVAKEVGIDEFYYEVMPQDKERIVAKFKGPESLVSMVGDGVNDAPAITRADIGIAIGSGTDIAIDAADIVLMGEDLHTLEKAIKLSKATIKNIRISLFWAFFYNIIMIPVAAGVLFIPFGIMLNPMICALLMSLSSVTVVTNSLRLRKRKI